MKITRIGIEASRGECIFWWTECVWTSARWSQVRGLELVIAGTCVEKPWMGANLRKWRGFGKAVESAESESVLNIEWWGVAGSE